MQKCDGHVKWSHTCGSGRSPPILALIVLGGDRDPILLMLAVVLLLVYYYLEEKGVRLPMILLVLMVCCYLDKHPGEKLGQKASDADAGADADIGLLLSRLPSEEGTGRQWRDTWWGYLHIMGHPYIFPAYRGCHLLVEETDNSGTVLVQEGHRRLHIVAHRGLLLLGCKRHMRQVQEDDRLYPHRLGHIERQQEVYHMSDVTDILHQCIPEWEDYCTTGVMYVPKE